MKMRLDVIIPTFNREELIGRALDSLFAARLPDGLEVRVMVVDNNSTDGTWQAVERRRKNSRLRVDYLFEPRQGKSYALNAGIAATDGELIGLIDDDEEVDEAWLARIHEVFTERPDIDFIGGSCVPRWSMERPAWLPSNYGSAVGWVDGGDRVQEYGRGYDGVLMGGNAVIRRAALERAGAYSTELGPNGNLRLMSCEDEDMYHRLLRSGARGLYIPDLIIYHYVGPERLTKRYFRVWCFWRAVSLGFMDRERPEPVAYLAGVPRYVIGNAARGLLSLLKGPFARGQAPAQRFSGELALWNLAGFFYGKHFHNPAKRAGQAATTAS